MPFASRLQHLSVDPTPVVAYENAQVPPCIFDFNFDFARTRVAECIDHRFTAKAVDFIPNDRVQRLGQAFRNDAEINGFLGRKFFPNLGKRLFKIVRPTIGRAEASNRIAALFPYLPR